MPITWVGKPPCDANEEVPMVTQLDEERWRLWEMAKANLEKVHKRYKDFADKSWREVNFEEGDEVWLNIKNFRLLTSYKLPVGKKISRHLQVRTTKKS
jgi:hypothetical protein